ncbi:hypothetical protein ACOMHN_006062 [Nucella lapillus]
MERETESAPQQQQQESGKENEVCSCAETITPRSAHCGDCGVSRREGRRPPYGVCGEGRPQQEGGPPCGVFEEGKPQQEGGQKAAMWRVW